MALTVVYILGSLVFLLALGFGANYLVARYRRRSQPAQTDATPAGSPWPQTSLQRIKEETARRPPLSGPEI